MLLRTGWGTCMPEERKENLSFFEQGRYWNLLLLFQMKSYVCESIGHSSHGFIWFDFPALNSESFPGMSKVRWFRVVTFYIKTFIALDQFKNWYHNWWKGDIRASGYTYNLWWPVFKLIFILRNVNRVHDICNKHALRLKSL